MKIGLIGLDGKLPNLALMKLSTYWQRQGAQVFLNDAVPRDADRVYVSVIFAKNRRKAEALRTHFTGEVLFGGTGWDLTTVLPDEIEACRPDFALYSADEIERRIQGGIGSRAKKRVKAEEIVTAGLGFLNRGCVRTQAACPFCVVPSKEGSLRRVADLDEIINPASNRLILLDNNLTAAPDGVAVLEEIARRNLVVDITQGIDVRLLTPEFAEALGRVKLWRSLHFAWDQPQHEAAVRRGIGILSRYVRKGKQMCFMLVGFRSSWEEDIHRFETLVGEKVDPYVMLYNHGRDDLRLKHFARWVNARIYKVASFEQYAPWVRDRATYFDHGGLFAA